MKTIIILEPNDVYVLWSISRIDRLANPNFKKRLVILEAHIWFSSLFEEDEIASVLSDY